MHNPDFNYGEFAIIKSQAGLNCYKISVKQWRDKNPDKDGNMRDYANVSQLVCLANFETLNAHFIQQRLEKTERLTLLNQAVIQQMRLLVMDSGVQKLNELN